MPRCQAWRSYLTGVLVAVTASGVLSGCAAVRQTLGTALVTPAVEAQLGLRVAAQVEKQERVLANPELQAYVGRVAAPLAARARQDRPDVAFAVTVLDQSGQANAFAVPGGHLYVYTGLLLLAQDEAELAGVLAHEMGHVVARHSANQLAAQYGLELLTSMALGENPPAVARTAANLGQASVMARFSRDDELQADRLAVRYLADAGYDPTALASLFGSLLRQESGARTTPLEQLLASHPATGDRIRRLQAQTAGKGGSRRREQFATATAALRR